MKDVVKKTRPGGSGALSKAPEAGKRRQRRRRKRRAFSYSLLVLFVLASALTICVCVFFHVETFEIKGESPYTVEEIVAASGFAKGDNLYAQSCGAAQRRIREALPYVERVTVRKAIPGTIAIQIQQSAPTFYVEAGGDGYILSDKLKVLEKTDKGQGSSHLIHVYGMQMDGVAPGKLLQPDRDTDAEMLREIYDSMAQNGIQSVKSIDLRDKNAVSFVYNENIRVQLGSMSQLSYKLTFVRKVINDKISANERVIVDASQAGRVSVRPDRDAA